MRKVMTVEDYVADVGQAGPIFASYRAAFVSRLKLAGIHGEELRLAVDALERARTAPGTHDHWKLVEAAQRHHRGGEHA